MGFDAGSIEGTLELDRTQFDESLQGAQDDAKKFEDEGITVPLRLDDAEFDEQVEEDQGKKEDLATPVEVPIGANDDELDEVVEGAEAKKLALESPVDVPITADSEDFDVTAAGVEMEKGILETPVEVDVGIDEAKLAGEVAVAKALLADLNDTEGGNPGGVLALGAGNLGGEAADAKAILDDLAVSSATTSASLGVDWGALAGPSIAEQLKAAGITAGDLTSGITLAGGISADDLADALLPSPEALAKAFTARLATGMYAMTEAGSDPISGLYSVLGGERTLAGGPFTALGADGEQLALPSGLGNLALGADGEQLALGAGPLSAASNVFGAGPTAQEMRDLNAGFDAIFGSEEVKSLPGDLGGLGSAARAAESVLRTQALNEANAGESLVQSLMDSGASTSEVRAALQQLGHTAEEADMLIADVVGTGEGGGGGGGGFSLGTMLGNVWKKLGSFSDSLDDAINKVPGVLGGLPGLTAGVPLLGAGGLALGGAIAGTSIGTAGTLWALVPGLLDLVKGYEAYSDQQSGTADPGASQGTLNIANAIRPIVSGGSSLLGGLETTIDPQIVSFLNAFDTALTSVAPFADAAVGSMGKFFGVIDSGMQSSGFKSFMAQMTADVGPIMDEFGGTIINVGKAFGDFLSLFGGGPAQMVGNWFTTETGKLDTFLAHAKISPSFMAGAQTVFSGIASTLDTVFDAGKKVFEGLAPIGLAFFRNLTPAMQGIALAVNAIPPGALTALGLGLLGLAVATDPLLAVAGAILAIGLAIHALNNIVQDQKPLTFSQLKGAITGDLTPASLQTAAEKADIAHANALGYTPTTLGNQYRSEEPVAPTPWSVTAGYHSRADSAPSPGDTPAQLKAWEKSQPKIPTAPSPKGWTLWGLAVIGAGKDFLNWYNDLSRDLGLAAKDIEGFGTDILNWDSNVHHALDDVVGLFEFMGKTTGGVVTSIGHYLQGLGTDFLNWDSNVHHATDDVVGFFSGMWGQLRGGGVAAWQALDNNVFHPLETVFTTTIPGALHTVFGFWSLMWTSVEHDGVSFISWIKGLPGDITSSLGSGLTVLSHWGSDLIQGIANAITGSAHLIESALHTALSSIPGASLLAKLPGIGPFFKAQGGPVSAGMSYIVGEQGPEVFSPNTPGMITPNNRITLGGGGHGAVFYISVDARGSGDVNAVTTASRNGVTSALPALRAAMERGTGSLAGVA